MVNGNYHQLPQASSLLVANRDGKYIIKDRDALISYLSRDAINLEINRVFGKDTIILSAMESEKMQNSYDPALESFQEIVIWYRIENKKDIGLDGDYFTIGPYKISKEIFTTENFKKAWEEVKNKL